MFPPETITDPRNTTPTPSTLRRFAGAALRSARARDISIAGGQGHILQLTAEDPDQDTRGGTTRT
jgi:hypothetical protein